MAYERRSFSGAAASTTITSPITGGTTTITIASDTGWPTTSGGAFYAALDRGTPTAETVLVTSRAGTTLTVVRGVDGTAAQSHAAGASIEHVLAAADANEANYAVSQTVGKVTAAEDLLVGAGGNSLKRLPKGTDGLPLRASGGTLGYGTVGTSALSDNSVTLPKLTTISTDRLLGRDSAGTGNVEQVALSDGLEFTGSTSIRVRLSDGLEFTGGAVRVRLGSGLEFSGGTVKVADAQAFQPGFMIMYGGASAPTGWLLCDGSEVSRTTYAALFAAIGTSWGAGNGTSTFNVPDMRGRVAAGLDPGQAEFLALGQRSGSKTHTLSTAELPSHNHGSGSLGTNTTGSHTHVVQYNDTSLQVAVKFGFSNQGLVSGSNADRVTFSDLGADPAGSHNHTISGSTASVGSGQAHNNLQPYGVVNYIIKT